MRSAARTGLALAVSCVSASAAPEAGFSFEDVSASCGIVYVQTLPATAVAVGDYNADALPDVLLSGSTEYGTRLFRNDGFGVFSDVTAGTLPSDIPNGNHALFADVDNDGDPDLLLGRWYTSSTDSGFALYANDDGTFTEVTLPGEPGRHASYLAGMSVADTDLDGDLDVMLARQYGPGTYLRNDGDSGWVDITATASPGFDIERRYWSIVLADFDLDGWVDLHAAIDFGHDFHMRNNGDGTFTDVSVEVGVSNIGADMGVAVGDIEGDGDLDIFSTNIAIHTLYVNDGGNFINDAASRGVRFNGAYGTGWGTAFVDFDHDADEDLVFIARGQPGSIYANDSEGYFTDKTGDTVLELFGYGLAAFDHDMDGDIDLLTTDNVGSFRFYMNQTPQAGTNWLIVDLEGSSSNRDGVGARIEVTAGGKWQVRHMMAGHSFITGMPMQVHFGLGDSATAERVEVLWPSGMVQVLTDVAADQRLTIAEPVDCNRNLVPDVDEINAGTDCNGNAQLDSCDIAAAKSIDADGNGTPDECQADCNANGSPDAVDVADGTSDDCNDNGLPDECEVDADDDGVIDGCDGCPADAAKDAPGVCGCGVSDGDTDGDGAIDCADGCPLDAAKLDPGPCGCGVEDVDTDADATPDCLDLCPNDPARVEPGPSGCGAVGLDSDGDGALDVDDGCPANAAKVAPGICGCDADDTDTDADGVADCIDECPFDSAKTLAGICGCNVQDNDSDGDGTLNCLDECPDDVAKSQGGACGCGVPDTDTDGDELPDCRDLCPLDPTNVLLPGGLCASSGTTDGGSNGDGNTSNGDVNDPPAGSDEPSSEPVDGPAVTTPRTALCGAVGAALPLAGLVTLAGCRVVRYGARARRPVPGRPE